MFQVNRVSTSQWGFTRPSSIYFSFGIVRDIFPLFIKNRHISASRNSNQFLEKKTSTKIFVSTFFLLNLNIEQWSVLSQSSLTTHKKNCNFWWKVIFFIHVLASIWLKLPAIHKWIEQDPWDWFQMKDNWKQIAHLLWNQRNFGHLLTWFIIWLQFWKKKLIKVFSHSNNCF